LVAYPLTTFANIKLNAERRDYLIKGLLPRSGLVLIWGSPKSGKSYWTMDVALHIALGREYRGRRVQQAVVIYAALEGRQGIGARIEAFRQHHQVTDAPFHLMTTPLDLARKTDALLASIEMQLGDVRPGAIFIDTLNRSFVGSESKDEDMAAYIRAAGKIEQKFGCLVVIVHHCGIAGDRPRGHTSLTAAVEVQIAVKRGGDLEVIATVELAKDMQEGAQIFSRLRPMTVGKDPDGDPLYAFVVVPAEASTVHRPTPARKLTDRQRLALDALDEATIAHGIPKPPSFELPASIRKVAPINTWRDAMFAHGPLDRNAASPREDFRRLKHSLQARKLIGLQDDLVWRA
jgi:hypothetical protein